MKLPCKSKTTTNGNMKKKNKLDKTYSLNNGNRSIHLIEIFNIIVDGLFICNNLIR